MRGRLVLLLLVYRHRACGAIDDADLIRLEEVGDQMLGRLDIVDGSVSGCSGGKDEFVAIGQ